MAIGVVGQKCGMSRVFTKEGQSIPVTVISVEPCRVTQIKNEKTDGYRAVQVTSGNKSAGKLSKQMVGHYAKANIVAGRGLWEFRVDSDDELENYTVGAEIGLDIFQEGDTVDVRGKSLGKGFAGGIKRHHFRTQDNTHGNSLSHRALGSIGQCQSPGRVFKGKKMAGQLGSVQRTMQNLTIVKLESDKNIMLVKGSIAGPKGGDVIISPAIKVKNKG